VVERRRKVSVPVQNRVGCDEDSAAATSVEQSGEGSEHGAALQSSRGVRRCNAVSWWRRTRISISLAVSERTWSTIQLSSFANIW